MEEMGLPGTEVSASERGLSSRLASAAIVVMLATLLSRVFGLVREQVMANYFGAGIEIDAYRVAFILPNLFRMLLADAAIGSAFIPVFTFYLAKGKKKEAWQFASTVINLMVLGLSLFLVLGMLFAPQLLKVLAPGFSQKGEALKLALFLTRIMFPSVLFMALAGLVAGILNSYEHFTAPALSPVLWNITIISMVVFVSGKLGVVSLALGITLGSLAQFIFQLPFMKGRGNYSLALNLRHPGVKEVSLLVVPVVLSLASTELNIVVDTRFASVLATGSIASLGYAVRLWTLPISLFAIALSTVLFPSFSKFAAQGNIEGLKETFSQGIRLVFSILIPASVGLMVLGVPIVRLIFERGEFTPTSTLFTACALTYYSIGIFAAGGLHLVNRVFYSLKDMKTPMIIAALSIVINYFGDWFLMRFLPIAVKHLNVPLNLQWLGCAHGGIALSTSLVCFFNFFLLVEILRRRLKGIGGRKITLNFIKVFFASVFLGLTAFYSWKIIALRVGVSTTGQLVSVCSGIFIGALTYLLFSYLFKIEEIGLAYKLISARFKRK